MYYIKENCHGHCEYTVGCDHLLLLYRRRRYTGNTLVEQKQTLSMAITSLRTVSDRSLMFGVVGLFAFFGLLIGVSLIMHGLTYNRIAKLQSQLKHRL